MNIRELFLKGEKAGDKATVINEKAAIKGGETAMKNNNEKVEVVFIMDRSGSMGGLEAD